MRTIEHDINKGMGKVIVMVQTSKGNRKEKFIMSMFIQHKEKGKAKAKLSKANGKDCKEEMRLPPSVFML